MFQRSETSNLEHLKTKIQNAIKNNDWQTAVSLVVNEGGVDKKEICMRLEVMQSTVDRWLSGRTEPPSINFERLGQKLIALL